MLEYMGAALFLVVILCGIPRLRETWHRPRGDAGHGSPSWWPWGMHAWNAFDRQLVPAYPGLVLLTVGLLFPEHDVWSFLFILVPVPLVLSIALFNRPKSLVPPAMRDQPGLIEAHWRRSSGGPRD